MGSKREEKRVESGEGKQGDWECGGCNNRNYAFRSFCNRCKQPRLLVDNKPDSKWLPRIGDWICSGCTNNNYASREKCKKCGQPKEEAAMPAIAMHGRPHPHYYARPPGGPIQPLRPNWPFGAQPPPPWPHGGPYNHSVPYANQPMVPEGWRSGDWLCNCGFHNYSSRAQCKKCNASMPPGASSSFASTANTAHGTKRLASEEFLFDWENKRLNAGHTFGLQQAYPQFGPMGGSGGNAAGGYPRYPDGGSGLAPNFHHMMQGPQLAAAAPTLLGKGAKQWRDGDWMCTKCDNHNYASRSECNRCKTQRETPAAQPICVVISS